MTVKCLKGGRLIDPYNGIDEKKDLYFRNGKIVSDSEGKSTSDIENIDVQGKIIFPGLVDLRCHLNNDSVSAGNNILAASTEGSAGGYTTLLAMPDLGSIADNPATIEFIKDKISRNSKIRILLSGSLTKGSKGEVLAPLGSLKDAGVVAFTDCPLTAQNNQIFTKGSEYASMFNLPVIDLPRDLSLSRRGNAHNGPQSLKMGLGGYPRIAEELFVQRAISVSKIANTRIHLTSISSSSSVEMIRDAKLKGSLITADVTPHHLSLCEKSIKDFNPNFKTSPPLREESDRLKLVQGLLDGTIDCIATAHEPYPEHEKNVEFDLAPTGVIGLETALSVCYQTLNPQNGFSWLKLISAMSLNPSNILNIDQGRLNIGSDADIVIFDPDKNWIYSTNERSSNATNSSFEFKKFKGKIVTTFFKGSEVYCT